MGNKYTTLVRDVNNKGNCGGAGGWGGEEGTWELRTSHSAFLLCVALVLQVNLVVQDGCWSASHLSSRRQEGASQVA